MKKNLFFIAALFAVAAVSCQKEEKPEENGAAKDNKTEITDTDQNSDEDVVVFTAKLPDELQVRTVIGAPDSEGNYTPLWTDSDGIIVNGVGSTSTEVENGGTSARFTVAGVQPPYLAIAPVSMLSDDGYAFNSETNSYSYLVPGAGRPQVYTTNGAYPTYDPKNGAAIVAYGTTGELAFHHLNVYYRITVAAGSADSDNIRSVYIRQGDGSNLAGVWEVTFSGGDATIAPKNTSNVIKFDCGEGGLAHGTAMIIAVPAYNFDEGLIITLKDVNGHFHSYSMKASATQFASKAGTVIDFNPVFNPGSGTINNADDWEAFAAAINSGKDQDLYRWVGNGTVKLGADISAAQLTRITGKFPYTFDGQNHRISQSGATNALFRNVRGTVRNLELGGQIDGTTSACAALVDTLYNGGRISHCTNYANISVNTGTTQAGSRAGGFVAIMHGGTIDNCINNGSVYSSVNSSDADIYNLQIGGIVGQVDLTKATSGDAVLYNCKNNGAITADPVNTSKHVYGINYSGIGGIAGWLRGTEHSFLLSNCDNTAEITYSAEHVTDPTGALATSISVGGIVGIAGDHNAKNGYNASVGTNGLDVTMRYCDNSGVVHNCGINYATTATSNKRVYTGGITGSLVGTSSKHARLARCRNTGTLLTYDVTGSSSSTRPLYCQVVGGLIGYGGYVDVDSCKVNCTIGNGKRQTTAIGGAIGHTMAAFSAVRDTVWFTGYFVRLNGSNHINSSSFATVAKKFASTNQSPMPDINGTSVKECLLGAKLYYYDVSSATDTADNSANCTNTANLTAAKTSAIRGQGYNTTELMGDDITLFQDNTTLSAPPAD